MAMGYSKIAQLWDWSTSSWKSVEDLISAPLIRPRIRFQQSLRALQQQFMPPTIFQSSTNSFYKTGLEEEEIIIDTTGWAPYDSFIIRSKEQNWLHPRPAMEVEGPFPAVLRSKFIRVIRRGAMSHTMTTPVATLFYNVWLWPSGLMVCFYIAHQLLVFRSLHTQTHQLFLTAFASGRL